MVPENWLRDSPLLHESMDELAPGLAMLEFLGGEPLLFDEHFDLLALLVDRGHAGHVELRYVTNGTRLPSRAAGLWPHFKRVGLQVSLDGVGAPSIHTRPASPPLALPATPAQAGSVVEP